MTEPSPPREQLVRAIHEAQWGVADFKRDEAAADAVQAVFDDCLRQWHSELRDENERLRAEIRELREED